eukprot:6994188-Prymnesium_polylepis.1
MRSTRVRQLRSEAERLPYRLEEDRGLAHDRRLEEGLLERTRRPRDWRPSSTVHTVLTLNVQVRP